MSERYDWNRNCTASAEDKRRFHAVARKRLRTLARELGFRDDSFDLRSNKGGPAVSGEVTLHHEDVYVQASQSVMGSEKGLLIRTCAGRADYTGGRNHFAPLAWLDEENMPRLVDLVTKVMQQKLGFNADEIDDPSYNPHTSIPTFSR